VSSLKKSYSRSLHDNKMASKGLVGAAHVGGGAMEKATNNLLTKRRVPPAEVGCKKITKKEPEANERKFQAQLARKT